MLCSQMYGTEKTDVHLWTQNGPQRWGGYHTTRVLERDSKWIVMDELLGAGLQGEF